MGITYAAGTVSNPGDPARRFDERFLVDTGALYSFIPADKLASIGIGATRRVTFRQMDGSLIERDVGRAMLRIAGIEEVVPVVLAAPGDATVLGVVALESLGLGVDPTTGQLAPVTLLAVTAFVPTEE